MASNTSPSLPDSLDQTRITALPAAAYYISDFITEDEEASILDKIASAPKPRWKQLTHRRLQTWPSDLVNNTLIDAPLHVWLEEPVVSRLRALRLTQESDLVNIFHDSPHQKPNHVLINEYPPGVGIMPHKDGSAYHPVVCTVSLGASLCLNIHKAKEDGALEAEPAWRILQEPRSLLITTADLYTHFLHGIADITEDVELSENTIANWALLRSSTDFQGGRNVRQTRTSLTYRDVLKVSKLGSKLGVFLKK
ncbi:Alkbh6 protein [Biscogniauxia mediterranea]|nr:Alkbh6 protein [Biscogniauxia mediterranea]